MKYAIISDIHSNVEALSAVLAKIEELRADEILCLGDLVGYHANPNEIVGMISGRSIKTIAGNHDRAAIKIKEPHDFSPNARRAIYWTRTQLSTETVDFIYRLPTSLLIEEKFLLTHGAVHPVPNEDVRLNSEEAAAKSFEALKRDFPGIRACFFGHTHHPLAYELSEDRIHTHRTSELELNPDSYYLINPGSVGQSRDEDPRSSFLVYDTDRSIVEFHRTSYDTKSCRKKAGKAGLIEIPSVFDRALSFSLKPARFVYRRIKPFIN